MIKRCLSVVFCFFLILAGMASAEVSVSLIQPSPDETLIATGRDFYVIAKLTGAPEADVKQMRVRLVKDGAVYRETRLDKRANAFKTDYENMTAFNADHDEWLMPDIIYDPSDPESLGYAWNKCYYQDGCIVALITGGLYHDYIKHINEDGTPFRQIVPGEYEIQISTDFINGESVAYTSNIRMGVIAQKVLSRFSPAAHMYNVMADAQKKGFRVFTDAFPGYWSPPAIFTQAAQSPYFAEIKPRWQFCDGVEYMTGNVHLYVYNITSTCASNSVEIGILQSSGAFGAGRVSMYAYDIGEPEINYTTLAGDDISLTGATKEIAPGDALVLCRAEITRENRDDNVTQVYMPEVKDVDSDLSDGVTVGSGQYLTILGVAPPFQNSDKDIIPLDDNSFQTMNRASKVEYVFSRGDETLMTATRDIALARYFAADWQNTSIYEFAHTFDLTELSGAITVALRTLDSYGEPLASGEERFTLTIADR